MKRQTSGDAQNARRPPIAEKRPVTKTVHGRCHADPYDWIRAGNWRDVMADQSLLAADIRSYIEKENTYTADFFATLDGLPEKLVAELRGRIRENDTSPPVKDGPYLYCWKYGEGADFPRYLRKRALDTAGNDWMTLFDGQALREQFTAGGASYFNVGAVAHSPDHSRLLYCLDLAGQEIYDFFVKDLKTGDILPIAATRATRNAVWDQDSRSFYCTVQDENLRPCAVMRHNTMGDPHEEIYREEDPGFFVSVGTSEARDHLIVSSNNHNTSELWVSSLSSDTQVSLTCLSPREAGHEYSVAQTGGGWFIRTNQNDAEDFAICSSTAAIPDRTHWRPYLPHRTGILIEEINGTADYVTWVERHDGALRLYRSAELSPRREVWETRPARDITPVEGGADIYHTAGHDFSDGRLRVGYSTLKDPATTVDIDLKTGEPRIVKTQEIPSGHDAENYVTTSLTARSHDGAIVPVSIIHHRDTKPDGSAPVLLYGYGSYGHSLDPSFGANRFSLIDRGFVYALAHCRGGMDKGYGWYRDSLKGSKKNSFFDFLACANELIAQGYTAPGRIIAHGGSAGGMLVGASVNMAPDLFAGVIAEVPFVDCLNTMLDDSLPLTPPEWEEWGNPITDERIFDYIRDYAPYETIRDTAYPFIYATGGLADPRVTYWEPVKWIARLRDIAGGKTTDAGRAFYLDIDMSSGHGGAAGRLAHLEEVAKSYAFALAVCS